MSFEMEGLPIHTRSVLFDTDRRLDHGEEKDGSVSSDVSLSDKTQRYHLAKDVGESDGCRIFLVHDQDLKRLLVMKMVPVHHPRFPRYLEEVQIMGQLGHPHIGEIHEMGQFNKEIFYWTAPHVPGHSLFKTLEGLRKGEAETVAAYSLIRLVSILHKISLAVAYAHSQGVIHRNICPKNVWLGDHGEVLLRGWSTAKVVQEGEIETDREAPLTQLREMIGDPLYISPEQVTGQELGPATDVYSLGVVLYEILTLRRPFEGSMVEVLTAQAQEEPVMPTTLETGREIPSELEWSCMQALEKSPEKRHPSVTDLAHELRLWLDVESDKLKRHAKAEEWVRQGECLLEELKKQDSGEAQQEVDAERFRKIHQIESVFLRALGADPNHPKARQLLAEHYYSQYREAERAQDLSWKRHARRMVERYDDGRLMTRLQKGGADDSGGDPRVALE